MDPEQEIKVEDQQKAVENQKPAQESVQVSNENKPAEEGVQKSEEKDQAEIKKQIEDVQEAQGQKVQGEEKKNAEQSNEEKKQEKKDQQKQQNKEQQQVEKTEQKHEKVQYFKLENSSDRPISVQYSKDSLQMEDNQVSFEQPTIVISVPSSEDRGFALNKHTFYKIVGKDNHGSFQIQRRLSQFQSLRKILLERWPGCFIPFLSERSDIKSQQLKNYHKRRNLEQFLIKIAMSEFIYYKEEVQLFLRSIGMDMNEMFQTMPTLKVKDVAERFKVSFGQDVEKSSPPENATYITRFSTSLKKVINSLGDLSKKALRLADSYDLYRHVLPKFGKIVTNYEQSILSQYTAGNPQKFVAMRDSDKKLQKFNVLEKQNIFYEFYYLFQTETRDAEALVDIILAMEMFNIRKDQLQTKSKEARLQIDQICLGYKNLKVMTSRRPKEEVVAELEQKQKEYIAEKHSINELYNISEIVLSSKTIKNFKKMKKNNYLRIIKQWSEATGAVTEQLYTLWKFFEEEAKIQVKKADKN